LAVGRLNEVGDVVDPRDEGTNNHPQLRIDHAEIRALFT
jgi:hypothetical protein